ncbi:HalOD1 output domain-containing protein (plasmid) [Haloferacaceae archaeon DSL9]
MRGHQQGSTDTESIHERTFDPDADSVSQALLEGVMAATGSDPRELPVLSEVIDPDAIDALFRSSVSRSPQESDIHLTFNYDGYFVEISGDGTITLS